MMLIFEVNLPTAWREVTIDFREKDTSEAIISLKNITENYYFIKAVCVNPGVYILNLTSSEKWDEDNYVSTVYNGEERIYRYPEINSTELLFFSYITSSSMIKRSDTYIWNWYNLPEIDWIDYPNEFPDRLTTTTYYRLEFNFNYIYDPFSYILCKLRSDGAIVIYLNGHLLYRRGLGSDFFRSDYSKKLYSSSEIKEIRLNANALLIGKNILGIEIHKHSTSQKSDPFKLIEFILKSDTNQCTVTNTYDPPMLIKNTRGYEYYREQNIDNNPTTKHVVNNLNIPNPSKEDFWYDQYLMWTITPDWYIEELSGLKNDFINATGELNEKNPLDITMGYPNNIAETFTQYKIQTGPDYNQRDPWSWKMYGSYDNTTGDWDLLQEVKNSEITTNRLTFQTYPLLNQYQSYEYYRFVFTKYRDILFPIGLHLARLHFLHCKPRYCREEGNFPKSRVGFTASIPCKSGFVGSIERKCILDNKENPYWGVEIENCRSQSTILRYSSELIFYKGYSNSINPVYDNEVKPIQFETNCTFPIGISLNPESGVISGNSSESLDENIFIERKMCNISLINKSNTIFDVFEFTYKSKIKNKNSSNMSINRSTSRN